MQNVHAVLASNFVKKSRLGAAQIIEIDTVY